MAEERDDPVPTDDPRQSETSDQNAEESHPGTSPSDGGPSPGAPSTSGEDEGSPDAPSTSAEEDGDPGQATGNPNAAG
jgi:hypothetical protein